MDNNQKRFVEDALDLLNELDEGLMQLEANPIATAPLEQVFRTLHTLKGGANMFGFEHIGELAHQIETLYDLVRQGTLQVSDGLISLTLQAFDTVRDILQEKDITKMRGQEALQYHLQAALDFLQNTLPSSTYALEESSEGRLQKDILATILVRVVPAIKITEEGNHPLVFIVQDIAALGASKQHISKNESGEIDHWAIIIATTVRPAELETYFIFVEGECTFELHHLGVGNLLEDEKLHQAAEDYFHQVIDLEQLKTEAGKFAEHLPFSDKLLDGETEAETVPNRKIVNDTIIKVSKRKIDDLLNWISELIILQSRLSDINSRINSTDFNEVTEQLLLVTNHLRDTSLEIGLVPIETLVTKFKRLVRDLSKSMGKKVNFLSEGADTEMDKDVIEIMGEPIMHIIRNAIDHGIETPEERKAAGKSEHGTVKIKAFNSSAYINIIISDDGRGIHKENIVRKAIAQGLVSSEAALNDEDIYQLIFHAGLSTASQVSEISGRGVGMDVVKQKIHELRGNISIKSQPEIGTAFHIKLPLSRSIIEGLLVNVAETRYVIPLNMVDRIDRIPYQALERQNYVNKTVVVNEEPLSVLSIREEFHHDHQPPKTSDIISVTLEGIKKGIAVDRIEGKIQAVLKPLSEVYQQQDFIVGSTILGDGSLALVLDPQRIFNLSKS